MNREQEEDVLEHEKLADIFESKLMKDLTARVQCFVEFSFYSFSAQHLSIEKQRRHRRSGRRDLVLLNYYDLSLPFATSIAVHFDWKYGFNLTFLK